MKFPKRIQPLIDDGLVDEVISQLMRGRMGSAISSSQSIGNSYYFAI